MRRRDALRVMSESDEVHCVSCGYRDASTCAMRSDIDEEHGMTWRADVNSSAQPELAQQFGPSASAAEIDVFDFV